MGEFEPVSLEQMEQTHQKNKRKSKRKQKSKQKRKPNEKKRTPKPAGNPQAPLAPRVKRERKQTERMKQSDVLESSYYRGSDSGVEWDSAEEECNPNQQK